ncbi:alpha/beta fold hydrolase [Methylorubrum podarium]|uniref:Alpha/beta fold hydrolase n=1 Tax=Methylorubrum podarium TaxID=200476 RepID=A0ABV1QSY5_9HYPH
MTEGVLLLHGIARRAASLRPLERELAAEGYATLNRDYPARRLALADIAEMIAPQVAAFAAGVSRLHIVTHSMGGLVARVLLARHRPANLGRVVMLGPPNGGSEVADALHRLAPYRRFFGPAGAELVTLRGAGQERLFGPVDYPLGVIAGRRSLYPLASLLLLPGPNDGRVTVARTRLEGMADHVVLPAAHPTLMRNRRALSQTLHFLCEGRFDHR